MEHNEITLSEGGGGGIECGGNPRIMHEPSERCEFFGFLVVLQGDGENSAGVLK
jgi:hypothetical protein